MKTLKIKVENMASARGNDVPNQFKIRTADGVFFQSYDSIIAYQPFGAGKTCLDKNKWGYSRTTGKYRNMCLRETKKETSVKIDNGVYELVDLN